MTRLLRSVSSSKRRLTLVGAVVIVVAAVTGFSALAYFTSTGSGTGLATTGSLDAPSITSATPGGGTVALTWSTVTPPAGGSVTYSVKRDGGAPGGDCPASGSPTAGTSCTDSGVSIGSHHYTVTAVWRSWTATSATQIANVTTGPLNHFLVTPTGVSETAGTPFSVTVRAKDSLDNTITTYAGTIHFTSSDAQAVLPGNYTFTTGAGNDNGVHTFTSAATLKTAGSGKTVMVSDGASTGTATYAVNPGAATNISLTGSTGNLISGTPRTFTATVKDAYGNTATSGPDSNVSINLGRVSGVGTVTGEGATTAVAGVATKDLTGQLAGPVTVQAAATLTGSGVTNSDTLPFNVVHGSATQVALSASIGDLVSGTARTFTATVEDAAGNTVTDGADSNVSVSFAQSAGSGSLTGAGSATASTGVATKDLTGDLAGALTVRATATLSGSSTSSNPLVFNVVAGPVSQLVFTTQPAGASGGIAFSTQPAVTAKDAAGNTVTGYGGSVALSITGGTGTAGATLSGCTPSLVNGVTSFTGCRIDKAGGGYQLRATDGTRSVDSNAVAVAVGAGAQLSFTTSPSNSTAGTPFATQPVVTVQDAGGNTVTGDTSSVTLAITSGTGTAGAALTCTANPKAAASGVATFAGCKIDKAGTGYTLTATDGTLTSAVSGSFHITGGTPTNLVLSAATTTPTAAAGDNLTITAKDAGGNTVTSYTGDKSLTFAGATAAPEGTQPTVSNKTGTAVAFGTATTITFTNGVATVSGANNGVMTLYKVGSFNITVSDGSINNGTGLSVSVAAGTAAKLAWTSPNVGSNGSLSTTCLFTCSWTGAGRSHALTTQVSVTDANGNIVSNLGAGRSVAFAHTGATGVWTSASLTIPAAGAASTATNTFTTDNSNGWASETLTASSAGFANATMTVNK